MTQLTIMAVFPTHSIQIMVFNMTQMKHMGFKLWVQMSPIKAFEITQTKCMGFKVGVQM
jgi:hypothetical protein